MSWDLVSSVAKYLTSMFKTLGSTLVIEVGLFFKPNMVVYAYDPRRMRQEIAISFKLIQTAWFVPV